MLISIIIPCFNEEKYIEEIIKRVLNQNNISKEIIIVDDGSTDGTTEILKKNIETKEEIVTEKVDKEELIKKEFAEYKKQNDRIKVDVDKNKSVKEKKI